MSNPWALWRKRLIDNAQLAFAMQAKLAKGVAFMRHRSTRLADSKFYCLLPLAYFFYIPQAPLKWMLAPLT